MANAHRANVLVTSCLKTPVDPHTKAPLALYERQRALPCSPAAGRIDNRDYEKEVRYRQMSLVFESWAKQAINILKLLVEMQHKGGKRTGAPSNTWQDAIHPTNQSINVISYLQSLCWSGEEWNQLPIGTLYIFFFFFSKFHNKLILWSSLIDLLDSLVMKHIDHTLHTSWCK